MKAHIFVWHLLCGGVLGQNQKLSDKIKENIVREVFEKDPALAASAIRLSFHDCVGSTFVQSKMDSFPHAAVRLNMKLKFNYTSRQEGL